MGLNMNEDQYKKLRELEESLYPDNVSVKVEDFSFNDGTLLFGYDIYRDTWHVYIENGYIHALIYNSERIISQTKSKEEFIADLIPNKRVYYDTTNLEFAEMIVNARVPIVFTDKKSVNMKRKRFEDFL